MWNVTVVDTVGNSSTQAFYTMADVTKYMTEDLNNNVEVILIRWVNG